MTRVALYLRQSKDAEGEGVAIDRQLANCRALAEGEGWTYNSNLVFVDNNTSATSSRPRPAYQRMIEAVKAREVDVVIAWNLDRLTRKPREIEDWIDLHEHFGVNLMTSERKDRIDLSTESGRMILRITASVARQEVERKGRRQKESNVQARGLGLPPAGRRAFGYTLLARGARDVRTSRTAEDGRTYPNYGHAPIPAEAEAIRRGYALLLAGGSLRAVARDWNADGFTTTSGKEWEAYAVRNVLTNPRNAALVAPPRPVGMASTKHRLALDGLTAGTWEPIVDEDTWRAACKLLSAPERRTTTGAPPRRLVSGIARCGVLVAHPDRGMEVCGASLKGGAVHGISTYRCNRSSHLSRKAEVVDQYVTATLISWLARPEVVEKLVAGESASEEARKLKAERSVFVANREELKAIDPGVLWSREEITRKARAINARIDEIELRLDRRGRREVLAPLLSADDLLDTWEALDIERQRAVIRAVMSIEVGSPGKGSRGGDPAKTISLALLP